jgi:hypothetical protein
MVQRRTGRGGLRLDENRIFNLKITNGREVWINIFLRCP